MNARFSRTLSLVMMLCLLCSGAVFAVCLESSTEGKLTPGRMNSQLPQIIQTYEDRVPKGAIYVIQEHDGFYLKICDEPAQVSHFIKKWVEPSVSNGEWGPLYTTDTKTELAPYIKEGVYLIKYDGANWAIWKYAADEAKPVQASKLYIQTDPADASIRVLNIKPKFSQGMALDPGRYHIEIAAGITRPKNSGSR